jgi:hypothetical protein
MRPLARHSLAAGRVAAPRRQLSPSTFIAAVFGSPQKTGSTCSTTSAGTSRKLRLFSIGISARRAPLSFATWSGHYGEMRSSAGGAMTTSSVVARVRPT